MITSSVWSVFFVLAVAVADDSPLRFSLEPAQIQPGQHAVLTIRLNEKDLLRPENSNEEELFPDANDEALAEVKGLEILDQDYRKEKGDYIWRYQFTSYTLGKLSIPAIPITFGPQSFSTERVVLDVVTHRADQELRAEADTVWAPWNTARIFLFLLLALGTYLAWRYGRKYLPRRAPRLTPVHADVPVAPDPREWLRQQLLVLRARIEAHPEDLHAPDAWSGLLREFASRTTKRPITAWTTREMQSRLQQAPWTTLTPLLQSCDQWKFSSSAKSAPGLATLQWIEESEKALW